MPISTNIHCFDAIIKPLLLYGCEVWGQDILHTEKDWKIDLVDSSSEIERIHLKFCKSLLNVPIKSSNVAVRSELGRMPLIIAIMKIVLKYYSRLEHMSNNRLLKQIYEKVKPKKFSLANLADEICNVLSTNTKDFDFSNKSHVNKFNRECDALLPFDCEERWFSFLSSPTGKSGKGNKLRTYKLFKRKIDLEDYLEHIETPSHRSALTRLRISAHNLRIERGRYERVNNRMLEEKDRLCRYCSVTKWAGLITVGLIISFTVLEIKGESGRAEINTNEYRNEKKHRIFDLNTEKGLVVFIHNSIFI